jgi:hypothetical protein
MLGALIKLNDKNIFYENCYDFSISKY